MPLGAINREEQIYINKTTKVNMDNFVLTFVVFCF